MQMLALLLPRLPRSAGKMLMPSLSAGDVTPVSSQKRVTSRPNSVHDFALFK